MISSSSFATAPSAGLAVELGVASGVSKRLGDGSLPSLPSKLSKSCCWLEVSDVSSCSSLRRGTCEGDGGNRVGSRWWDSCESPFSGFIRCSFLRNL